MAVESGMELTLSDKATALHVIGTQIDKADAEVKVKLKAVIDAQAELSRAIDDRDAMVRMFENTLRIMS
jgi:hypothetical protein